MLASKIRKSNLKINPKGGILFPIDWMRKVRLPDLIESYLPKRAKQAKFSNSDAIIGWALATLCGAERLDDTNDLRRHLCNLPGIKIPHSSTLSRMLRALKTQNIKVGENGVVEDDADEKHHYNINCKLNDLLLACTRKLQLINPNELHVLDFDSVVLENEKHDSRYTYKKYKGYNVAASFIDKNPIYLEPRNGNSDSRFMMRDTLERTIDIANKHGYKFWAFRSDSAAYIQDVIQLMQDHDIEIFIKARESNKLYRENLENAVWETVELKDRTVQVTAIEYEPFKGFGKYRLIIQRMVVERTYQSEDDKKKAKRLRKQRAKALKNKGKNNKRLKYRYADNDETLRPVITNNWSMSAKEVLLFYNKRGDTPENNFKVLLNDFHWHNLPFSFLNENTVFMIVGAITHAIYRYILHIISEKIPDVIPRNSRIKKVINRFISIGVLWVTTKKGTLPIAGISPDYMDQFITHKRPVKVSLKITFGNGKTHTCSI